MTNSADRIIPADLGPVGGIAMICLIRAISGLVGVRSHGRVETYWSERRSESVIIIMIITRPIVIIIDLGRPVITVTVSMI